MGQSNASAARTSDFALRLAARTMRLQKITPMLWFDNQAEEAANFYVSVFKNSKVKEITHYAGEEFPKRKAR